MDRILLYTVLCLGVLVCCTQADLSIEELKAKILALLEHKKEQHNHPHVDEKAALHPHPKPIHLSEKEEEFNQLEKRDWINYAKEDELLAFMKEVNGKIADIEAKVNADYCENSPCLNYGKCVNRLGGYECQCKPGFVGPVCDIEIGAQATETLSVDNGGKEGDWYAFEMCPSASFATGFRIKLEKDQGAFGDDSAVNAIEIQCTNVETGEISANISSREGVFGDWRAWQISPKDFHLVGFEMKVEPDQGSKDDSSVNGIAMYYRGPGFKGDHVDKMIGPAGSEGQWGTMSKQCPMGEAICGLATRVESPQGGGDDSGLNDVQFKCCYWW